MGSKEPTELEIARIAKEMQKEYLERFGPDALQPDFIESARRQLTGENDA